MANNKTRQQVWYDFVLQQMAAESFLDDVSTDDREGLFERLRWGSNDGRVIQNQNDFKLNTRMTNAQADYFLANWEIVDQHSNDPTGFSATLMKNRTTGEFTLAFRSTEFAPWSKGGDFERDSLLSPLTTPSANAEISSKGLAFGQITSMEKYFAKLKASVLSSAGPIYVTGYSLGGHLATVFTELHSEDVKQAYSFNGAGRGAIEVGVGEQYQRIQSLIERFGAVVADPSVAAAMVARLTGADRVAGTALLSEAQSFKINSPSWNPFVSEPSTYKELVKESAYTNPVYRLAKWVVEKEFHPKAAYPVSDLATLAFLRGDDPGNLNIRNAALVKIQQIYGKGANNDVTYVANSGSHGITASVLVEDQPDFTGNGGLIDFYDWTRANGDFGTTHSITLIADSLALISLLQEIDPRLQDIAGISPIAVGGYGQQMIEKIIAAASNSRGDGAFFQPNTRAEHDSLELALEPLRKLFAPPGEAQLSPGNQSGDFGNIENRDAFYNLIAKIREGVAGRNFSLEAMPQDASAILARAESPPHLHAYRYALKEGHTYAIEGFDYSAMNVNGELSLFDASTGKGQLTQQYLKDRAEYLEWRIASNNRDSDKIQGPANLDLHEEGLNVSIRVRQSILGFDSTAPARKLRFAQQSGATLEGGFLQDGLYGGAGADSLDGRKGRDNLEGGLGVDSYIFREGDGRDSVFDLDGLGNLKFGDQTNFIGLRHPDQANLWVNQAAGLEFKFEPKSADGMRGDLIIRQYNRSTTSLGGKDQITIKGFDLAKAQLSGAEGGYLDIKLSKDKTLQVTPDTTVPPIVDPDGTPPEFRRTSFNEGGSTLVNVSLNSPMEAGQKLRFKLSETLTALGAGWKLMVNGTAMAFNGGELIVDAPAGKSQQLFTLVSSNEQPNDVAGKVEVTLLGADGNPVTNEGGSAVASELGLDIKALQDEDTSLPAELEVQNAGEANHIIGTDAAESIDGGAGADLIEARDGNDLILNAGDGRDKVLGEAGNDRLVAGNFMPVNWRGHAGLLDDQQDNPARAAFLDGGEGNDRLLGEGGDDLLAGGAGEDLLLGGAGSDLLVGDNLVAGNTGVDWNFQGQDISGSFSGNVVTNLQGASWDFATINNGSADVIHAGTGNDYAFGEGGNDTLHGEAGNDFLAGGDGNDTVLGGTGNDVLRGDFDPQDGMATQTGDDILDGGDGNDRLRGNRGNDALYGGSGNDVLSGDDANWNDGAGEDYLDGGDGDDSLFGGAKDDKLFGGSGKDELVGDANANEVAGEHHGDDYLDGEAGDDKLLGSGGDDRLFGGDGADQLFGDASGNELGGALHGDDYLDGEGGDDELLGQGGADRLFGAAGDDVIQGDAEVSDLAAEFHGDDEIDGEEGNDTIFGQGGNDLILGGEGDDYLDGDDDTLPEEAHGNDTLEGGDGNDSLLGRGGDDELSGDEGDDVLEGGAGNDTLEGGEGEDTLSGGEGDDYLDGGSGQNVLEGGEGNDTLVVSGEGGVYMGGAGDDTYYVSSADSMTFIADEEGENRVVLFDLDNPEGLELSTVQVRINRSGSTITGEYSVESGVLDGAKQSLGVMSGGRQVLFENAFLSGNTRIVTAGGEIALGAAIAGSVTDNVALLGTDRSDTAATGRGNDAIHAGLGDDSVESNAGNDYIDGGIGNDTLKGGEGNDVLYGGAGDDTLVAGTGIDALDGGEGNDVFVLSRGDGVKFLSDWRGDNRVRFGEGISLADIKIERYSLEGGTYTAIFYGDAEDQLSIAEFEDSEDTLTFEFSDGTSITREALLADRQLAIDIDSDVVYGTEFHDVINAGAASSRIFGLLGDDRIYAGDGDDYVEGNEGDDFIQLGSGAGSAYGGEGKDELIGGMGNQRLSGDAGDDVLDGGAGDDMLEGGAGNDRLLAGAGDDVLSGGEGDDLYIVGSGDGVDVISDELGNNVIRFSDEVVARGMFRQVRGNDLFIGASASSGVLIKNYSPDAWRFERASDGTLLNPPEGAAGAKGTDLFALMEQNKTLMREAFDQYHLAQGGKRISGGYKISRSIGQLSVDEETILWQESSVSATAGGEVEAESGKLLRNYETTFKVVDKPKTAFTGLMTSAPASPPPPQVEESQTFIIIDNTFVPIAGGNGNSSQGYGSASSWYYRPSGSSSTTTIIKIRRPDGGGGAGGSGGAGGGSIAGSAFSTPNGGQERQYGTNTDSEVLQINSGLFDWVYLEVFGHATEASLIYMNEGGVAVGGSGDDEIIVDGGVDENIYAGLPSSYPLTYSLLSGGAGDDNLFARGGSDIFIGGDGSDKMYGGYGKDVYIFNAGESGVDMIVDSEAPSEFIDRRVWSEYWEVDRFEYNYRNRHNASNINIDNTQNRLDGEDVIRFGTGISVTDLSKQLGQHDDSGEDDFLWNRRYVDLHVGGNQTIRVYLALDYDESLRTEERTSIMAHLYESDGTWGEWTENGHIPGGDKVKVGEEVHLLDENESRDMGIEWVEFADGSRRRFSNLIATLPIWSGAGNQAPIAAGEVGNREIKAGSSLDFYFGEEVFTDDNGFNGLTFSATLLNGDNLPDWLSLQGTRFVGQPPRGVTGEWSIRLTATDAAGLTASTVFSLNVGAPDNTAPEIGEVLGSLQLVEDTPFQWSVPVDAFSDLDDSNDALTLDITLENGEPLPEWLQFDPLTRSLSASPGNSSVGAYQVRITATDSGGLSASQVFTLSVANTNDGPAVADGLGDAEATEGTPFEIALPATAFADEDVDDVLTYSVTMEDGSALPDWLQFDAETRTLSGLADDAQVGAHRIRVTATDSTGASASASFTLSLRNVNEGPILNGALSDVAVEQNASVSLVLPEDLFADPDSGDTLTYSVMLANGDALPDWLSFDAATRTLSGVPGNDQVGGLQLKVVATDGGNLTAFTQFTLTVQNVNDGPVAVDDVVVADSAGGVSDLLNALLVNDSDPDAGDQLAVHRIEGEVRYGSLTLEGGGNAPIAAAGYQAGGDAYTALAAGETAEEVLTYTVRDGSGAESTAEVRIRVTGVNDGPELVGGIDDVVTQRGSLFSFAVPQDVFVDKDHGDVLTYSAVLTNGDALPTWLSFNQSTGRFSGRPGVGDVGSLNLMVTATDTAGASVSTGFMLTVNHVNNAPEVVGAVEDFAHFEDEALTFVLPEGIFADADGETLNYSVTLASGDPLPAWLVFDAASRTLSGTPGNAEVGQWALRITASDAEGEAAATDFVLTVVNTNDAPIVFVPLSDRYVRAGEQGSWAMPATAFVDVDGDALSFTATAANGDPLPEWLQIDASTGTVSAAPASGIRGEFAIKITATDPSGAAVTDEFKITVAPPDGLNLTGGNRSDTLRGGWGDDTIDGGSGGDSLYGEGGNDRIKGSRGADMIDGGDGDDVGLGGAGFDSLFGRSGDDYLNGEDGQDTIDGGTGNDLLEGGLGADTLLGGEGNNLLNGQGGADQLLAGGNNDILIGGLGRDDITTGNGNDVIAFNRGDGADTVHLSGGGSDTLSLGGDVDLNDLRFQRQGDDLKLLMGDGDSILFDNYYAAGASRSLVNLQIVRDAEAALDATHPLHDNRVEVFDFNQLVARFDAAQAARPNLNRWQLMDALLEAHTGGADAAAYGGDLAFRYGTDGTLAGISVDPAKSLLANHQLNNQMQSIKAVAELKTGGQTLS